MQSILNGLIENYPELAPLREDINTAYEIICSVYENGGKLLACGNGGSAADADHIVGELMKGFLSKRPLSETEKASFGENADVASKLQCGLPAISLCAHSGLMTAYINDCEPDCVFAQQVYGYSRNGGDVLIALSTSGNSANVVNAVKTANAVGVKSISITGSRESILSEISTVCLRLPSTETYRIQELTLPVYHCLCAMVEKRFFG